MPSLFSSSLQQRMGAGNNVMLPNTFQQGNHLPSPVAHTRGRASHILCSPKADSHFHNGLHTLASPLKIFRLVLFREKSECI